MPVDGYCDPAFEGVRNAFAESFQGDPVAMTTELGAALSVWHRGRPVVDLWGGHTSEDRSAAWREDTIVCVQSVSKGVLATCAHILVDRGLLDVERPMAAYWPEFAAAGKAALPVKWALSHLLGLPAWQNPEPGMGYDWRRATQGLADSAPDLVPGRDAAYHPYTFGFLVGELVCRVSGQDLRSFLRNEVTGLLEIDFDYGAPGDAAARCATFGQIRHGDNVAGTAAVVAPLYSDIMRRALDVLDHDETYNSPAWREAVIPAANGHTNGRALARHYAMLAAGGALDGRRVLSEEAIERATQVAWSGRDLIIPADTTVALGYMLNCPSYYAGPNPRAFGHAGFGGAYGFADRENDLSFGYTPNRMWLGERVETGARCSRLVDAVYACLG